MMLHPRRRALVASVFVLALMILGALGCNRHYVPPADAEWTPGTHTHALTMRSGGRSYLLHIPTTRPRSRLGIAVSFPVVIVLHGSGADGAIVRAQSGIDAFADSLHFIAVYPNGSAGLFGFGSDWNAGTCCGTAARTSVDDVGFLRAVVADLSAHLPIDARRIYVAGFSDGGRLAYRVACDAAPIVAAIGVVSGSMLDDSCHPERPVPLVAFHGTSDTEVPYDEPPKTAPRTAPLAASVGLPPSVRFWSTVNRCRRLTESRITPHVLRAQFGACGGADILFFAIDSGAHAWPGGAKDGPDGFAPTRELNASSAMVSFFLRHTVR